MMTSMHTKIKNGEKVKSYYQLDIEAQNKPMTEEEKASWEAYYDVNNYK